MDAPGTAPGSKITTLKLHTQVLLICCIVLKAGLVTRSLTFLVTKSALRFTSRALTVFQLVSGPLTFFSLLFLGAKDPFLMPRGREKPCRCRWHLYVTWIVSQILVHWHLQLSISRPCRNYFAPKCITSSCDDCTSCVLPCSLYSDTDRMYLHLARKDPRAKSAFHVWHSNCFE